MVTAVDLFAGAGGFTTGAQLAGVRVAWAGNHWPIAVRTHADNHPDTTHACQDLHQVDWHEVPRHDLLLASPACQGHSRARGADRPRHDAARSTAWAVVSCAEVHRPEFVIVENVPEMREWILYDAWTSAFAALGYSQADVVIDAADVGVPQHRRRLFVVFARARAAPRVEVQHRPHVGVGTVLDFGSGSWAPIERPGRSPNTLARVAAGRAAHGDRFVVSYYGTTRGGRSLARPIGTLTTRDRWAVVDGDRMRMLSIPEARAVMGFPSDYVLPSSKQTAMHMLGNAVVPHVAAEVIRAVCRVAA